MQKEFAGTDSKAETEAMLRKAIADYEEKQFVGKAENITVGDMLDMEEKQSILALGAGASTKFVMNDRIERAENVKDIKNYIERIDEMIERKKQGYCDYEKNRV